MIAQLIFNTLLSCQLKNPIKSPDVVEKLPEAKKSDIRERFVAGAEDRRSVRRGFPLEPALGAAGMPSAAA